MKLIGVPAGWPRRFGGASTRLSWLARFIDDAFDPLAAALPALAARQWAA